MAPSSGEGITQCGHFQLRKYRKSPQPDRNLWIRLKDPTDATQRRSTRARSAEAGPDSTPRRRWLPSRRSSAESGNWRLGHAVTSLENLCGFKWQPFPPCLGKFRFGHVKGSLYGGESSSQNDNRHLNWTLIPRPL